MWRPRRSGECSRSEELAALDVLERSRSKELAALAGAALERDDGVERPGEGS